LVLAACATSCESCYHESGGKSRRELAPPLTVEDAKNVYESLVSNGATRTDDDKIIPFDVGEPTLHWEEAGQSSGYLISSVDIPISDNYNYMIGRRNDDGSFYTVYTSAKFIVVKSSENGDTAVYVRICIPDNGDDYDACNRSLNCDDRGDYCGLEYYMTVDGAPVAVAKFIDGQIADGVFLGNENLSVETRVRKFVLLMHDMYIRRYDAMTRGSDGFMDYGAPGDLFLDQFGNVLVYQDTDHDGKSDAVTDVRFLYSFDVFEGGSSTGYNGGGNSGSDGMGNGGIGSGNVGSGGTGGGSGAGTSGGSGSGGGTGTGADGIPNPTFRGKGARIDDFVVDPLKWDDWISGGIIPSKSTEEEKTKEEEKPKADSLKCVADPLMNMEILGTPISGVKGGRFGKGRGRMHNGCDLKADVGTPVYAMFGGKVTYVVTKFDPNISWEEYPEYFSSPRDYNAGNRLWIEGQLANGNTFRIKYFHLNSVNMDLFNKTVQSGTIVGTTGATGAACDPNDSGGPHLHVEIYINGQIKDPEEYFFTKLDENGKPIIE